MNVLDFFFSMNTIILFTNWTEQFIQDYLVTDLLSQYSSSRVNNSLDGKSITEQLCSSHKPVFSKDLEYITLITAMDLQHI